MGMPFPVLDEPGAGDSKANYWQRLKTLQAANLLALWRMNEAAGAVVADSSGNSYNGSATGVTWGQAGIGDGGTAPLFDGANDYIDVQSAGLTTAFNAAAGTVSIWVNATTWNDGAASVVLSFRVNNDNAVLISKATGGDVTVRYRAGATNKDVVISAASLTNGKWHLMTITWSVAADEVKVYLDGAQSGLTQTSLGTWVGAPGIMLIGAVTTTPTSVWAGKLALAALWNVALTPAQIASLMI